MEFIADRDVQLERSRLHKFLSGCLDCAVDDRVKVMAMAIALQEELEEFREKIVEMGVTCWEKV